VTGVLITRPPETAVRTAGDVARRGLTPVIDPMLEIRVRPGPSLDLTDVQAFVVTSANGVRALMSRTQARDCPVYAVGRATADAARAAGFAPVFDAAGDAGDLARLLRDRADPAGGRLLHVSGADMARDLGAMLAADGFRLERIVGYEAVPAKRLRPETETALRTGGIGYALFFSPRTARTFVSLAKEVGLSAKCGAVVALCLSSAVAAGLRELPWRRTRIAARPTAGDLLDLLPGGHSGAGGESDEFGPA